MYCSPEEKRALEQAAALRVASIPGAKLPTYRFVLQAALAEAKRLGVKVEG